MTDSLSRTGTHEPHNELQLTRKCGNYEL